MIRKRRLFKPRDGLLKLFINTYYPDLYRIMHRRYSPIRRLHMRTKIQATMASTLFLRVLFSFRRPYVKTAVWHYAQKTMQTTCNWWYMKKKWARWLVLLSQKSKIPLRWLSSFKSKRGYYPKIRKFRALRWIYPSFQFSKRAHIRKVRYVMKQEDYIHWPSPWNHYTHVAGWPDDPLKRPPRKPWPGTLFTAEMFHHYANITTIYNRAKQKWIYLTCAYEKDLWHRIVYSYQRSMLYPWDVTLAANSGYPNPGLVIYARRRRARTHKKWRQFSTWVPFYNATRGYLLSTLNTLTSYQPPILKPTQHLQLHVINQRRHAGIQLLLNHNRLIWFLRFHHSRRRIFLSIILRRLIISRAHRILRYSFLHILKIIFLRTPGKFKIPAGFIYWTLGSFNTRLKTMITAISLSRAHGFRRYKKWARRKRRFQRFAAKKLQRRRRRA